MIPYGRQEITEDDIQAVVEVLRSDFLTQGPVVPAFEKRVAEYCNVKFSVAVSNATCALHVACLALELRPKDLVWTTPISFVASANCALYCGAKVDFVDVDPNTYNMSVDRLREKLEIANKIGALPKIVITVHLTGQACEMEQIYFLSEQYGFKIIEDASHGIGGRYQGAPIGNCQFSDVTIFSFHPVKIITTGEGGIAVTNDQDVANRMRLLRSHGITRDPAEMNKQPDGPWYYEQICLGFNYRMTDIQAALGLSQMNRLDDYVSKRTVIANRYNMLLADMPLTLPSQHPDCHSAKHLYVVRLNLESISKSHLEVFLSLRERGIGVNVHYMPIYLQPYYRQLGFEPGYCLEGERYYAEAISLPIYPGLTEREQDEVVIALGASLDYENKG
jgi:UDP-4-amino-4,6-dideoxy-N-acetyl-beta-L-altrosamine transaminase